MTYEEIVSSVKEEVLAHDMSGFEGHLAVEVNIRGEGEGVFYIELKDGKAYVEPYEYHDRDCRLIVGGQDFIDICTGKLDAVKAFMTGKLKVEGSVDKALEFSKITEKTRKKKDKKRKQTT